MRCLWKILLFFTWTSKVSSFHLEGCENNTMGWNFASTWESDYRIPQSTQPLHYELYLFPNLDTNTFSGHVTITVETKEPRNFLLTHIKWLTIQGTKLHNEAGEEIQLRDSFEYAPHEFWVVVPKDVLPVGNYFLSIKFEGRLDRDILGFYKSTYVDRNGAKHKIATSKFQPTYARRAFPCFDEPSFKSTFTTTLVKPSGSEYKAISNMPEASSKPDQPLAGFTEVTFQKSVPMVTYLAIFVVCDFEYLESVTDLHQIPFRVYGTEQQKDRLEYALKIGSAIADFYESYFDIPYPLPKLDMAAIPDYSSGATEHWGLITYRETNLLFDPKTSSTANKERVAMVIAHELAHQWFGNLMTVFWWNDLWLNEGFATYIEYKGVKSYETDWDMDAKFLTGDLHPVLELDATLSSHPIVVDVDTPDEINSVFDTIAYNKGASVIRMMEDFMGPQDFRRGISNFLRKFAYQNAITEDLLKELSASSTEGLNVTEIMNTWTRQKGFPVLVVSQRDSNGMVSLTQERFLSSSSAHNESSPYGFKWEIPLSYKTSNDSAVKRTWFHSDQDKLELSIPGDWIKFNVGQYGYYRVQYPLSDWEKFATLLQSDASLLSSSDRTSLINDAFALAKSGRIPFKAALDLTLYLGSNERAISPWETAFLSLDSMADILYFTPIYSQWSDYLSQLVQAPLEELGWTSSADDSMDRLKLRTLVLKKACTFGSSSAQAGQMLLDWRNNGTFIEPDLREIVYSFGMKSLNDHEVWKFMLERYKVETNAQEKQKLLRGLTAIGEPWILSNLLNLAKDESIIRSQDFFTLLTYMSWNRIGVPIVWDFVRSEWPYLEARFTLNNRLMGRMISDITETFASELKLEEMRAFFSKYPNAGAGAQYRKIALETVENNIKFLNESMQSIENWLRSSQH